MSTRIVAPALIALAIAGCGHVGQGEYQDGMESIRAEMNDRFDEPEQTDEQTRSHLGSLEGRIDRTEDELKALARCSQMVGRWYPGARITVEGFTDPTGPAEYNQALGLRRAEAVRAELISLGLDGEQLMAVSYGENSERRVEPGAAGPGSSGRLQSGIPGPARAHPAAS